MVAGTQHCVVLCCYFSKGHNWHLDKTVFRCAGCLAHAISDPAWMQTSRRLSPIIVTTEMPPQGRDGLQTGSYSSPSILQMLKLRTPQGDKCGLQQGSSRTAEWSEASAVSLLNPLELASAASIPHPLTPHSPLGERSDDLLTQRGEC